MASSVIVLMPSTTHTVTTTQPLTVPSGGFGSATFLWNITAITGTWDCTVVLNISGNPISVATLVTQTTTGIKRLALTADFSAVQMGIPIPNSATLNEAVAGTITSEIYMIPGD